MHSQHPLLLSEIEEFLSEFSMGASYFGKQATGNSEVVHRLRNGRRVWPETADKIRSYMMMRRREAQKKNKSSAADIQATGG